MFKKSAPQDLSNDQSGPFLEIELYSDYPYASGQPLEGCIHLNAKTNLENTDKVTIEIVGEEITSVMLKKKGTPIEQSNTIIEKRFTCYDYATYSNTIQKGSYAYPFKIHLPEWLPTSHLCYATDEKPAKPSNKGKYGKLN
jgi:hypothetical protein